MYPTGDTGEAALKALTKCDEYRFVICRFPTCVFREFSLMFARLLDSWCHMMEAYDATMTREAFTSGTMSHAWGTAPITGTVNGIMGLSQTAPAYKAFTVKPRLGGVKSASVKVPTPHGAIWINATAAGEAVAVSVPCNTRASLCAIVPEKSTLRLALDGEVLLSDAVRMDGKHACVDEIGCGASKFTSNPPLLVISRYFLRDCL